MASCDGQLWSKALQGYGSALRQLASRKQVTRPDVLDDFWTKISEPDLERMLRTLRLQSLVFWMLFHGSHSPTLRLPGSILTGSTASPLTRKDPSKLEALDEWFQKTEPKKDKATMS